MKRIIVPVLMAALFATPTAGADPDDWATTPDQDALFRSLLDIDGTVFNFKMERYQGLRYCHDLRAGKDVISATDDLAKYGGYSWDVANSISTAAGGAYCPDAVTNALRR